jgi:hypothetical protein
MRRVLPKFRATQAQENLFVSSAREPVFATPQASSSKENHGPRGRTPSQAHSGTKSKPSGELAHARSTSFQPETPTAQLRSTPRPQQQANLPRNVKTPTSPSDGTPSSVRSTASLPSRADQSRLPKRKFLSDDKDDDPDGPAPRSSQLYKKPRRMENGYSKTREIPSTPDRVKEAALAPKPLEPTPKTSNRTPIKTMFIEENDESEEEEEPILFGAIEPSQTLTEPSKTPRRARKLPSHESPSSRLRPEVPGSPSSKDTGFATPQSQVFETAPTQFPQSASMLRSPYRAQEGSQKSPHGSVDPQTRLGNATSTSKEVTSPLDTQAILTMSTQIPDFTLAEPEGGWSTIPSPVEPGHIEAEIDAVKTDFSVPSPPPPPSVQPLGSPQPNTSTPISLSQWLTSRTTNKITRQQVSRILMSTSMDATLADVVLGYVKRAKEVPALKGVWSEDDDRDLQGTDTRALSRLLEKHGDERVNARFEFLEKWRTD